MQPSASIVAAATAAMEGFIEARSVRVHRANDRVPEASVDATHRLVGEALELFVLLDPGPRRHRHLHERDVPPMLRVPLQQACGERGSCGLEARAECPELPAPQQAVDRRVSGAGHVMIVPFAHLDELQKLAVEAAHEMIDLAQRMERVLRQVYKPEGINLGMNLGKAAGAGVAGHVHLHLLPRWAADANFMTVVGETRVLPETLETTYGKIKAAMA